MRDYIQTADSILERLRPNTKSRARDFRDRNLEQENTPAPKRRRCTFRNSNRRRSLHHGRDKLIFDVTVYLAVQSRRGRAGSTQGGFFAKKWRLEMDHAIERPVQFRIVPGCKLSARSATDRTHVRQWREKVFKNSLPLQYLNAIFGNAVSMPFFIRRSPPRPPLYNVGRRYAS